MKKYIYCQPEKLQDCLNLISAAQRVANTFYNVTVKDYKGKKYQKDTKVICIG